MTPNCMLACSVSDNILRAEGAKYFLDMLNKKWVMKNWDGPPQFVDAETGTFMMLSTDLALTTDVSFRPHVDRYAADEKVFKTEFAAAFAKLLRLGTQ